MITTTKNPLLETSPLTHEATPFDLIKTEHFMPALEETIAAARTRMTEITGDAEGPSFANTIETLESLSERVDLIAMVFFNLLGAETNDEMQKLAQEVGPKLAEFSSDLVLDPKLFARVKAVYDERKSLKLDTEQSRLLENTYSEFVRNGALLDEQAKGRLREIDQRLSQLSPQFAENVLKATNAFELYLKTPDEIAGLPEGALEAARAAAEAKGRAGEYLFTLQAPSYIPVIKYAAHRPIREHLVKAYACRAYRDEFDNEATTLEIVRLRHERARLLGYETHAHFVLEKRMAERPERVMKFLEDLLGPSLAAALRDVEAVQEFASRQGGPRPIQPWDFQFYAEKLKEDLLGFNEEDLRPYFRLESVIDGVFKVAGRLYGLTFRPAPQFPVYHPDVRVYEVFQERGPQNGSAATQKRFMGLFYADFFPRPGKRDGAWMTNYREQAHGRRPHVSIVCNFTKSTPTKPSLLTLMEVRTLFHEFGHALHSLMSDCRYRTLGGTNVYWDFVELPSQLMENWLYQKEALDLFAHHYETNAPMPAELIEKVRASQQFLAGYNSLRQLSFAFLDMAWYGADPAAIQDLDKFEREATARMNVLPHVPGSNRSCSFGHIFGGGYAAGYYSYKWAEVLDADAFEFFLEKGIFSTEVAALFEKFVLSRGGSEHPAELYRRFRGREPDPRALLRRDGLVQ
jgi:peptidyl-dipeptidase Dcp